MNNPVSEKSHPAWIKWTFQKLGQSVWKPLLAETRSQILLCYIGLMLAFVGIAVPCIYYVLFREVDHRVEDDLMEEVGEFREFITNQPPESLEHMRQLMSRYLHDELAEDDQYLIFIADEKPYISEPEELPTVMQVGSPLMDRWRMLQHSSEGDQTSQDPAVGRIVYRAEPIAIDSQVSGLFIIARSTSGERAEVDRIIRTVLLIMLLILLLAAAIAWLISARILRPLQSLTATAQGISESDLSQRIQVTGTGELAKVATTFNEMMDRLEAAFTSQQKFIRDASHELRTPITIIQGHLDVMGDDPQDQQETLEIVHDELDRMNRFVSDILTLAKAERPDFIQPEPIDLDALTNDIYRKAEVITQCDCQLSQKASGTVWLDSQRITQAIVNLVENANQHTPATGLITFGSALSSEHVRFWVKDTGQGIHLQDQEHIFEQFARVQNQLRRSEGAGLGLSIVRAIAEASGGYIELQSKPGQGSTFTLVLPVQLPPRFSGQASQLPQPRKL
ncbi:MAG: HAMP domain-containing sensor histidine kinase [Cyanobacteria bacterium P01_F01_bin.86]